MRPRKYDIGNYRIEQAENGHVTAREIDSDGSSGFLKAHMQYNKRINRRDAKRIVHTIEWLTNLEALEELIR